MNERIWNSAIPFYLPNSETPNSYTRYLANAENPAPCVIVLQGGAYCMRAGHEGAPVAKFFQDNGIHAVVVDYRVAPNRFPAGLADVQRVIRIIRRNANEWKIDPKQIYVCGFSAGGHLAASTAFWESAYEKTDEIDEQSACPNGLILCYPVISIGKEWGHAGSGKNLLGEERYEKEQNCFCLSDLVSDNTPPTFLWHTSDDGGVPVKNSIRFAEALGTHHVPFELHIYPHGRHGLGLASETKDAREWTNAVLRWIRRNNSEETHEHSVG